MNRFLFLFLAVAALALPLSTIPAMAQMPAPAQIQAPGTMAPQDNIEKYTFNKPHTQILFSVNHLGFTNAHGRFLDYDGFLLLDRTSPEKSQVEATIKTASLDMGDAKWTEHLQSKDFFDVAQFPLMTFKSTKVIRTGQSTADVTGNLTIRDITKPVVLHVVFNKSALMPMGGNIFTVGFTATTEFKRSDFGMTYGLPLVGDDVHVTLEVQGDRPVAKPETPASAQ